MFADWLEEHGDPLGEFIRVQLELEKVGDDPAHPRAEELQHREYVLQERHGDDWLGAAAGITAEYPAFGPVFRRGLPEFVCLSLETFLTRGKELFAGCPTVREVSLYGVEGRSAELAACPFLDKVETLEVADPVYSDPGDAARALAVAVREARVQRFRVAASFTPHLAHEFARKIAGGWPRWIDLLRYTADSAPHAPGFADALNRVAGRPVARVVPLSETTFPLNGDLGHGLYAGRAQTRELGTSLILAAVRSGTPRPEVMLTWFSQDGYWIGRNDDEPLVRDRANAVLDLARLIGFDPGPIRVHPFSSGGMGVRLWPRQYVADYLGDRPPLMSERAWRDRGGVLRRWLHEGRFVIEWDGREFFADRSGTIFSS